jgi:hypothetical protein
MAAINDLKLAMIAKIKRPTMPERVRRTKPREFSARIRNGSKKRSPQAEAADLVHKDAHLHSPAGRGREVVAHFPPARVIAPDEEFEMHVLERCVDPRAKSREKLGPVDEQPRFLGRGSCEIIDAGEKVDPASIVRWKRVHDRAGPLRDHSLFTDSGGGHFAAGAQLLPHHVVTPKEEVEKRAPIGKKDHRPSPRQRGSGRPVLSKDVGNERPGKKIAEPDGRPVHGVSAGCYGYRPELQFGLRMSVQTPLRKGGVTLPPPWRTCRKTKKGAAPERRPSLAVEDGLAVHFDLPRFDGFRFR